ncbi:hypothetical protein J6590_027381 [Homalodisca vitripennis]|nr:hypothetical protein J6590_027381 [Homalodisca vitripennis]
MGHVSKRVQGTQRGEEERRALFVSPTPVQVLQCEYKPLLSPFPKYSGVPSRDRGPNVRPIRSR